MMARRTETGMQIDTYIPNPITSPRRRGHGHGERPALKVECIEDTDTLTLLRPEWDALLKASGADCLFLTWEWMATWWKHLAQGRRLNVLVVRRGDELLAIAPLALRPPQLGRLLPFRTLEFLGMGTVGSDYLDIITRPDEEERTLKALAEYLQQNKFVIEFTRVKPGSRRIAALVSLLGQAGWHSHQAVTDNCPYIPLTGHSWESYMSGVSGPHRRNVRRRLKILHEKFGQVEFQQARTEEEREACFQAFVELHAKRWSGDESSTAFTGPQVQAFHEEFSRLALAQGWLRLCVLKLDGKPVGATYSFRYGEAYYYYQAGYDPAYNEYSVGLVTLALLVQTAIGEGACEFDMLHGYEEYKFLWTRAGRDLARVRCFPPNAAGLMYRQAMNLRQGIKRVATWRWRLQELKA